MKMTFLLGIGLFVTTIFHAVEISRAEEACIYLLLGETGVGKSSFVNMMNHGEEIAKEGSTYESQTERVTSYKTTNPHFRVIDTPGLYDTTGFTNEEINDLIRTTVISESIDMINGVILIIDPTQQRIQFKQLFTSLLLLFDQNMLKNVFIIANKNNQIDSQRRDLVTDEVLKIVSPIYKNYNVKFTQDNIKQNLIFLDTKDTNLNDMNLNGLINKFIDNANNNNNNNNNNNKCCKVKSLEQISNEIQMYYDKELEDKNNYKVIIDEIPISEKKIRKVEKDKVIPYTEQCNCRKKCKRFLGIKRSCKTVCDTCARTRTEKILVDEEYYETRIEKKERTELLYTNDHLWQKAKAAMIENIRTKVYQNWQQRKSQKTKQEL